MAQVVRQGGGVGVDHDGVQRTGHGADLDGTEVRGLGHHAALLILDGLDDGVLGRLVRQGARLGGVGGDGFGQ